MSVTVAKGAGFCKGVRSAFDLALSLAEQYGKVYTLGALVHNELVSDFLQSKGVFPLEEREWDSLKEGDAAIIRAHGIPREVERELRERGVKLFDATCPVVKRNQLWALERAQAGDEVVVIGDPSHDEVKGVASYAGADVRIIRVGEALEIGQKNLSILFQTTVLREDYKKIEEIVKKFQKNLNNSLVIFNSICYTTEAKQVEARALAQNSNAVLVLGSSTSANTRRLFEVAKQQNERTFFVQNVAEAACIANNIKDYERVSIVAGASTPPWLIQEVTNLMSETQNPANVAEETEVIKEATLPEEAAVETEAAPAEKPAAEPSTMEELMKSTRNAGYTEYKPGKRVKGKVISANEDGIVVNIGGKNDGFIEKDEATMDGNYDPADFSEGDEIQAIILSVNKGQVLLSKKQVDVILKEDEEAERALSSGEFSLVMTEVVPGKGLRGKLGKYTIFVPASQIKSGYVHNLEDYKGKTLRLQIVESNKPEEGEEAEQADKPRRRSRSLVASQRVILEREKQEREDQFWNSIHVNDIVTGKVKRFTSFGAFVSVRGFDCLAHISELSWNKITDPSKVLKIGESYDFVVLKLDRATGRISLGYKQLQPKPYELAKEKYPVGTVIKGRVERIFSFGAFISIDEGVDGLVHVSQVSHTWVKDINDVLTVGQEVEAKIVGFDDNRITLSIKDLLPVPEQGAEAEADVEATDEERAAKRSSKFKKFEGKPAGEKRERKGGRKDAAAPEVKESINGTSTTSLGDLFKGLNLEFAEEAEEEAKPEEQPAE